MLKSPLWLSTMLVSVGINILSAILTGNWIALILCVWILTLVCLAEMRRRWIVELQGILHQEREERAQTYYVMVRALHDSVDS